MMGAYTLISQILVVIEAGLRQGSDPRLVKQAARLLQGYELLYWDTLHQAALGQKG
jgi:hypothetical protein